VEYATWFLHTHSFDGEAAAGPMPILFAATPETAAAAINSDPARAHFDLSKVSLLHFILKQSESLQDICSPLDSFIYSMKSKISKPLIDLFPT
jgi:hypothetical protein